MAILKSYVKQPVDRLDYDFDYSQWLDPSDELSSVVFSIEALGDDTPSTPLQVDSSVSTATYAKVWVVGGSAGEMYKVSCTITTSRGRVKQDEIKIRIKEY